MMLYQRKRTKRVHVSEERWQGCATFGQRRVADTPDFGYRRYRDSSQDR
jgi:hypothetical protein